MIAEELRFTSLKIEIIIYGVRKEWAGLGLSNVIGTISGNDSVRLTHQIATRPASDQIHLHQLACSGMTTADVPRRADSEMSISRLREDQKGAVCQSMMYNGPAKLIVKQ